MANISDIVERPYKIQVGLPWKIQVGLPWKIVLLGRLVLEKAGVAWVFSAELLLPVILSLAGTRHEHRGGQCNLELTHC